ncbi:hypothetical protein [Nocardia heshunensis]
MTDDPGASGSGPDPSDIAPKGRVWMAPPPVVPDTDTSVFDHTMAPHAGGTGSAVSPNGDYDLVWSQKDNTYQVYGPGREKETLGGLENGPTGPVVYTVDNNGEPDVDRAKSPSGFYSLYVHDREPDSLFMPSSPPLPYDTWIAQNASAPDFVQECITDANGVLHKILSQFGSQTPEVIQPYALNPSNITALENNQGRGADAYNLALATITNQEAAIIDDDWSAVQASKKMVDAHNAHWDKIQEMVNSLKRLMWQISPPDQPWDSKTMLDPTLQALNSTMEGVQGEYQSYCQEVIAADAKLGKVTQTP